MDPSPRSNSSTVIGTTIAIFVLSLCVNSFCPFAAGQGVLIPEDDSFRIPRMGIPQEFEAYRIREFSVDASIREQVATTQVTQLFENTSNRQIQASFVFPIPYDGAINQMTFLVDGKEYEARLLKADEARRIYEGYVRRNQDPALLEWVGQGMFRTSVFPIPAGATRTVSLKYTQLLRKQDRLTDYLFPLATARYTSRPLEKLSFRIAIESAEEIRSIYSPTHNVDIERSDKNHAVVRHNSTSVIPSNDFRLVFDSANHKVGASLISYWPKGDDEGYFLLLASPELREAEQEPIKKTVIFVVDKSGSMSGQKIEQARSAAQFVINNLRDGDLFNIISYESNVNEMAPELERFSGETRSRATGFVNSINAGGSTNISGALGAALGMIQNPDQPAYLVFLTDGLPTAGETNELKIAELTRVANRFGARLVSFGVGYDVNSRLLDRLTRENHGQSEYVRPDEDIEASVARLYKRIAAPVLANMEINFDFDSIGRADGKPVDRVYPRGVTDLFAGSQVVLIGRYRKSGPVSIGISGDVNGKPERFRFDLKLAARGEENNMQFIPQLWALRRIGEIIDLIDLQGQNQELVDELVALSKRFGIVTQYTSFLADDMDDLAALHNRDRSRSIAGAELQSLEAAAGEGAFYGRAAKQMFKAQDNTADQYGSSGLAQSGAVGQSAIPGGGGTQGQGGVSGVGPGQNTGREGRAPAQGIRKVGEITIYVRGKTIVAENASDVDIDKEKDSIVEIKRYSDEYFKLVSRNSPEENLILAEQRNDEELVVKLQGKIYRIK